MNVSKQDGGDDDDDDDDDDGDDDDDAELNVLGSGADINDQGQTVYQRVCLV